MKNVRGPKQTPNTPAEAVHALYAAGFSTSIAVLWGSGPKLTIQCGHCYELFKKRVPVVDCPRVVCPKCSVVNELPIVVDRD